MAVAFREFLGEVLPTTTDVYRPTGMSRVSTHV